MARVISLKARSLAARGASTAAASDLPKAAAYALDAPLAAEAADLRYVHDDEPGLRRQRRGKHWLYFDRKGARVTDPRALDRIAKLAIPPAWERVWICATPDGHIQATGRDARGRKQYRYHPRWRALRDEAKYEHVLAFGAALPSLRARVARDLASPRLTREKVIATILRVMELSCIRVGNEAYAAENGSFGLTTLLDRHAKFGDGSVSFAFHGKSGKVHRISVRDAKLASIVKRCRDVPGQRLFQWIDDEGAPHPVTSTDVNDYIREATGGPYTAKMIRTWSATVSAWAILRACPPSAAARERKRVVTKCFERIAQDLGNTTAICRASYVHPAVVASHVDGTLATVAPRCLSTARRRAHPHLTLDESAVLAFFELRTRQAERLAA
jgi:DNA topoisomerase-1